MLNQDDPKKCSALKLIRFGAVLPTNSIRHKMLVLNPFANEVVCKSDKTLVDSICVIDCSWNKAEHVLTNHKFLRKVSQEKYLHIGRKSNKLCKTW